MRDAKLHLKVYKADIGLLKVVKYRNDRIGSYSNQYGNYGYVAKLV